MSNLVSITRSSLRVLGKAQTGVFLIKQNCHSSRTSDDIDMKLGSVTKLDKGNKTRSKKIDDDIMPKVQSSARIVCKKCTFSLTVTFYLTKTENRSKKSLTQLSRYCFEKNVSFFAKNKLTSA